MRQVGMTGHCAHRARFERLLIISPVKRAMSLPTVRQHKSTRGYLFIVWTHYAGIFVEVVNYS